MGIFKGCEPLKSGKGEGVPRGPRGTLDGPLVPLAQRSEIQFCRTDFCFADKGDYGSANRSPLSPLTPNTPSWFKGKTPLEKPLWG